MAAERQTGRLIELSRDLGARLAREIARPHRDLLQTLVDAEDLSGAPCAEANR
jgi:hypothetical protein